MRTKNYYRVRTVVRVIFWVGMAVLIYTLATRLNYTDDGYCWGTIEQCYFGGK